MTDYYVEPTYAAWLGKKATTLRRRTLDCGHPNLGEAYYHLWCDRISCSEACAAAEHGCGESKGKSGIEEEAVEPEVVVEVPGSDVAPRPWRVGDRVSLADIRSRVPFSLPPEDYEALFGPMRATVTGATADEAASATRRFRVRSLECGALTKSLRCSGCDGLAMEGGGVCFHECHDWLADPEPPVDAALEPDRHADADSAAPSDVRPRGSALTAASWWSRLLPGRRTR